MANPQLLSAESAFVPPRAGKGLRIIPLGGCGEFGMNMTAVLASDRLFIIDCGVQFPDPARLGVDAILPAVDPYFAAAGGPAAYFITHGHEDHIGALPHILPKWPAPVYATPWTMELIKSRMNRLGLASSQFELHTVEAGDRVTSAGFDVEYVHVNHSIPNACALVIRTEDQTIFHTGDFKFESNPVIERATDFARLESLGMAGIDVLLADSTNADKTDHCGAESSVVAPLIEIFKKASGAVLLATFSSNLWRLKSIADACLASGRKIYICGAGIEATLGIAKNLGLYELPMGLRLADEQFSAADRQNLVILATGCQGEFRSALVRIANGEHKLVRASRGDTVVLSSRIIPGNEKPVLMMLNNFERLGCQVITAREAPGIHVSGHAHGADIARLLHTLKPKWFLPVHGTIHHLAANANWSTVSGTAPRFRILENGDVIDITKKEVQHAGYVDVDVEFVDSDSQVLISYEVLRDRLRIGELGVAVVDGVFSWESLSWVTPVGVEFIGLSLPMAAVGDGWMEKTLALITKAVETATTQAIKAAMKGGSSIGRDEITEEVRILVRRRLFQIMRKKPVVLVRLHFI